MTEERYCKKLANKIKGELNNTCAVEAVSEDNLKNTSVGKVVDCLIEVACEGKRVLLVIERAKTVDEDELKQLEEFLKNVEFAGSTVVPILHKMKRVKRKVVKKPKRSKKTNVLATTYASCDPSICARVKKLLG